MTSPRFASRSFHLAVVALVALSAAAGAAVAPTLDPGPGFEIEGDLEANTPTPNTTDWVPGLGGGGIGVLTNAGTPLNAARTFHIVDPYDLTDDVNPGNSAMRQNTDPNTTWTWGTNFAIIAVRDFNHGLVHFAPGADGHLWMSGAFDRRSTGGSSWVVGVELLQNTLVMDPGGTFTSAGPHGGRTLGDLLISLDLQGAGAFAYAARWTEVTPGSYDWSDPLPTAGSLLAANNLTATLNVPYGAFGSTTYALLQFGEMAADLTALPGGIDPSAYRTLMMCSRVSISSGAVLTDILAPIPLNLSALAVAEAPAGELLSARVHPNPARGPVEVEFRVPRATPVRLVVHDIAGREVARLADGMRGPGLHRVIWDPGRSGGGWNNGLFFVRCSVPGRTVTRRLALVR